MSTNCAVAYNNNEGWTGVYSHSDGYPQWQGRKIWELVHSLITTNYHGMKTVERKQSVSKAVQSFIDIYIKGHKGGWSSLGATCYCHDPYFVSRDGVSENVLTESANDPLFIEYVYVLDPDKAEMKILQSKEQGEEYVHEPLAVVKFENAFEPEWDKLEEKKLYHEAQS